jgi:hypothetical protein
MSDVAIERLRRLLICKACEEWDRQRRGCRFFKECKRAKLTRAAMARGDCRRGKWRMP